MNARKNVWALSNDAEKKSMAQVGFELAHLCVKDHNVHTILA